MPKRLNFKDLNDYKFYKDSLAKLADVNNLPTECTKYEFVKALKEMNMEYFNRLLEAYNTIPELQFYWNTVKDLDRNNEDFLRLAGIVEATEDEINQVFRYVAIARLEKPWLK